MYKVLVCVSVLFFYGLFCVSASETETINGHACIVKPVFESPGNWTYETLQVIVKAQDPLCIVSTPAPFSGSQCSLNFYWPQLSSSHAKCGFDIRHTYNMTRGQTPESWIIANMDQKPTTFEYEFKIIESVFIPPPTFLQEVLRPFVLFILASMVALNGGFIH